MWINGRWVPLAAPEGDAGGGGAPPPPPAEAAPVAPPPPQPDYAAIIAQQQAALQQMQQQQQELMQRFAPQQRQEAPDEEEYLDPAVKKQLEAIKRMNAESTLQLQDQMDQRNFMDEVQKNGIDNETAREAAQLHAAWLQRGMRVGNQPPSRIDALVYVAGAQGMKAKQTTRTAAQQAELARIAQNQDATLGVGGRATRAAGAPDLEKMSRKERVTTGYAAVLDTEGF